jgi:hypothetical protein
MLFLNYNWLKHKKRGEEKYKKGRENIKMGKEKQ